MRLTYIIIAIVLVAAIIIFFILSNSAENEPAAQQRAAGDVSGQHHLTENRYEEMRKMALGLSPDQLGLTLPSDETIVYGLIVDLDMGSETATVVIFSSGDASLYVSTGGAIIGGGQHENISRAARECVELAQSYIELSTEADPAILPSDNRVNFYLLSNQGIYEGSEDIARLEDGSSPWAKLFEETNKVLTGLREAEERR